MERVEIAEPGRSVHLRRDVPRLQTINLVQRDDDRDAEGEHALGDVAVACADAGPRIEHEEHSVNVLEGRVDRALHVLGQRVAGTLEAGKVGEHELVVVAVRDPEDPAARSLRLVRDDRDLASGKGVYERRLPDVRPSRDGDEARLHSSKVSGSSSAGVLTATSPSARR